MGASAPLIRPVTAPTSAAAAANAFVQFAREEPQFKLDQMKLQKLLFYAHAWHLAIKDAPLFEEDFEAWPWGPVVRNIYVQTAGMGRGDIDAEFVELRRAGSSRHPLDFNFSSPESPPKETLEFLREIWDTHKKYTSVQLSNSTHAAGEPWTIVKEQYGTLEGKPTIPNELIREVFKVKLADAAPDDPPA